jgi:5-amino-6-(5-phosphoribosylamino)uracil reductase
VSARPYVVLKCAMSLDGYIDDVSDQRLILSSAEDLDRADEVKASCDAILIGANTVRRDNPGLLVYSEVRRAQRMARGLPEYPAKVTVTATGLDPGFIFFHTGGEKFVYCPESAARHIRQVIGSLATVVALADPLNFGAMLDDLGRRGMGRLLVEGGGKIHTQFLEQDLADEIQLVVAPFLVGEADAPRFVYPASFPNGSGNRMRLMETRQVGDVALIRLLPRST